MPIYGNFHSAIPSFCQARFQVFIQTNSMNIYEHHCYVQAPPSGDPSAASGPAHSKLLKVAMLPSSSNKAPCSADNTDVATTTSIVARKKVDVRHPIGNSTSIQKLEKTTSNLNHLKFEVESWFPTGPIPPKVFQKSWPLRAAVIRFYRQLHLQAILSPFGGSNLKIAGPFIEEYGYELPPW